MLFQGQASESQPDVVAPHRIAGCLELLNRLTAAHPRGRHGRHRDGPVQAVVADAVGSFGSGQGGHVLQRDQLSAAVAHHQSAEILGARSVVSIQLHIDAADAAPFVGVIDVAAADGGADVAQGGAQIKIETGQKIAIKAEAPTGGAGIEAGAHPFKAVAGLGGVDEALRQGFELLQVELPAAAVQQFQPQAGFAAEAPHGWWGCDHHTGVADLAADGAVQSSFDGVTALITTGALLQGLKPQIERATVFAALAEGSAGIKVARPHEGLLRHHSTDAVHHRHRAFQAGPFRQGEVAADLALVFVGDEGGGHRPQPSAGDDQSCQQQAQHQRGTP